MLVAIPTAIPEAPFTIVNMVAGASSISFRDFALGTVLGVTPGIVLLVVMGGRFTALVRNPSPTEIVLFIGAVTLWLGIGYLLQRAARRLETKRLGPQATSDYGD